VTSSYPGGWLSSVSSQSASGVTTPLLSNASYGFAANSQYGGPARQITSATLGNNLYQYSATYDPLTRPTDLKVAAGSTPMFEQSRSFDAAGNVSTANTTLPNGATDNQAFCYDAQNRLTWAGSTGGPPCGL